MRNQPVTKKPLFLSIALLSIVLAACSDGENQEQKAPLRQVRSIVVSQGTGESARSFSGTLRSSQEASLSFKVSGTIQKIPVAVGDRVKSGDVIAELDPATYQLQAQQSKASLAEARANLRNQKANYSRIKNLYESGNVSRTELDDARAASDSAVASEEAARKAEEIDRLNLSYTTLRASDECAIASVDVDVGENITSGAQVVFATCGSDLEVKLDIPETIISRIEKGMNVGIRFSALDGKSFRGRVTEVGVSSIGGGTTFPVTVAITDSNKAGLKAGLSADVTFKLSTGEASGKESVVVVPSFAVGEDEKGRFIFVLNVTETGQAVVQRQAVKTRDALAEGIEILEGIDPGMRIVTAGVSVLREGMEVKYSDGK